MTEDIRSLPILVGESQIESEVGNQHILVAVLCGIAASAILTPVGGLLIGLAIAAIGQQSKNAATKMLAEMRRQDKRINR